MYIFILFFVFVILFVIDLFHHHLMMIQVIIDSDKSKFPFSSTMDYKKYFFKFRILVPPLIISIQPSIWCTMDYATCCNLLHVQTINVQRKYVETTIIVVIIFGIVYVLIILNKFVQNLQSNVHQLQQLY